MTKPEKKALVPALRFPEFQNAGMWDENTFGGVATFINGRAYKQEELLDTGKYRVLRVGNFFSNNEWYYSDLELEDNKYCKNGDLLYAWSASFGPRIWKEEKVIYHYHIWKVVENEGINKTFLFILLGYETERMKSCSANGLGLMHITKGAIENWKCYLPKIDEQQKIADCLSSIDDLITAQTQKLAALKAHKKALMQQLFPAEGETVPELRFPEFRDGAEWKEICLKELCERIMDGTHFSPKTKDGSRMYLTSKNIQDGKISLSNISYISEEEHRAIYEKCPVKFNDVLLTKDGANTGNCALNTINSEFSLLSSVAVIRGKSSLISQKFLYQTMLSDKTQKTIKDSMSGQAITRITLDKIGNFIISIPDQKEQQKIADCLSSIDELITAQSQKIEVLKSHKKGLMQQLFPSMDEVEV
ncbi:MAG: restriction endonuclease subunit S [Candidatus Thiothrix moscowensis]|nr:restriction endonuclease subunit S [Candidatus Thiothrix moscowensis]